MGFSITYQQVLKLHFWQYHWLLKGSETLTLPPDSNANSQEIKDRIIRYDLRNILKVEPTPFTATQLNLKGLIYKANTTGAMVASKAAYSETDIGYRLSFAIRLIDPEWLDYTETGVNSIQTQIFHLTNFGASAGTRYLLTEGGSEVLRSDHFVPKQGRIVRLPQQTLGTASTVEVFDALSNAATPVLSFSLPGISGQESYEMDCRSLREGLYRFEGSNINDTTIYLGLEDHPALIGVVDLFVAGWEGTDFDIRLDKP